MRKDLYLFRHGQTDLNVRGVWQGCGSDVVLNETGMKQAKELAKKVRSLQLTNLYSSPLLRAVQTANAIVNADFRWLPISIYQDLRECNFGVAEGLTFKESEEKFGKLFVEDFLFPTKENWDLSFSGGESKHQVFNRVMHCLSQIINTSFYGKGNQNRLGIVCHAGVISALSCGLGLKNVSYDNCSVLHLTCGGEMIAPEVEDLTQVFDV